MTRQRVRSGYPSEDEYGYSRAVRAGDTVFVSGTTARGEDLSLDTAGQLAAALRIVAEALAQAGATLDDVVRSTVYLRDLDDGSAIEPVHRAAFAVALPASTLVEVSRLSPEAARVEIEVTAVVAR